VRNLSLKLGRALGLERQQQKQLSLAAKLHDIGKFSIPEAILNKPGRLSASEYELVRGHPEIGEHILAPIIRNRAVLAAIRGHHERLDGGGYPDGLRGDQIPLLARIISIADCYDALTTSRAYRPARLEAEALDALRLGAGSQFDPVLIEAFLSLNVAVQAAHREFC